MQALFILQKKGDNNILYNLCKRMIENKNFTSKEDMQHKFDVFFTWQ